MSFLQMKPNVPAFTVSQLPKAMSVLQTRASQLMIPLEVAKPLDYKVMNKLKLGLDGDHQLINAGLAASLCKCWLQRTRQSKCYDNLGAGLSEAFLRGLSTASLLGRAQIIIDKPEKVPKMSDVNENSGELIFFLDGAHTSESMEVCARWFSTAARDDQIKLHFQDGIQNEYRQSNSLSKISKKILLFNCMEARDPELLLPELFTTCSSSGVYFSKALFVPGMSQYHRVDSGSSVLSSDTSKDVSWQLSLQRTWEKLIHGRDSFDKSSKSEKPENLLTCGSFNGEASKKCILTGNHFGCSSVIPSLPLALKWLRECAEDNPSLRLQVLVTGSMHLVGDVLKLLRR